MTVVFRRISPWRKVLERLLPALRRKRERRLKARIRWLCDHPEVKVDVE